MPVETPLLAVVPAFMVAALVLAALWRPWVKGDAPRPAWAAALALALAYIVADRLIFHSWPGLWSKEEHRRLPLVAMGAVAVALADTLRKGRIAASWQAWACGLLLMLPIMWDAVSKVGTSNPRAYIFMLLWWLLYAGAVALLWRENAATAMRVGGVRVPLVLCVAAAGASLTIIQSYAASTGFAAASIAAALGGFVAVGLWRPRLRAVVGATPVYAALLVGLLVCSRSTDLFSTILTILSAATAGLGDRGPLGKLKPWMATVVCVLITLVLAAVSIKLTPKGFDFSEGEH